MNSKAHLLKRGFGAKAERIAESCRKEIGLSKFDPLDAFKLASHRQVLVIDVSALGLPSHTLGYLHGSLLPKKQWDAVTIIGEDGKSRIIHNDTCPPARQQSNVMHEMAHVILEHQHEGEDYSLGFPVRVYNEVHEAEAEYLGGVLQLPRPALMWRTKQQWPYEQIATTYGASVDMVTYRVRLSGVAKIRGL